MGGGGDQWDLRGFKDYIHLVLLDQTANYQNLPNTAMCFRPRPHVDGYFVLCILALNGRCEWTKSLKKEN